MNIRWLAVKALETVYEKNHYLKDVLDGYYHVYDLSAQEKAFLNKLLYGTVEQQIKIDYVINQFSKTKTHKLKPFIYYVLSLSVYQLLEMSHVPDHAVCHEAVLLVKKRKMHNLTGFVNGVLRTISREKAALVWPDEVTDFKTYLHVNGAMPLWLLDLLLEAYDHDTVKALVFQNLTTPELTLRVTQLAYINLIKDQLSQMGLTVTPGKLSTDALNVKGAVDLKTLECFNAGWVTVQDESSMLVAYAMQQTLKADAPHLLDLCAAPGGKTAHLKALFKSAQVTANDVHVRKLEKIEATLCRLGIGDVILTHEDATLSNPNWYEAFDGVVADVPCSGLGVMQKKPDIKRFMTPETIASLLPIQAAILNQAARYVKPNGILIYSTCTINPKENGQQVALFLETHPEFHLEPLSISHDLPNNAIQLQAYGLQLLPVPEGTDGFFISVLRRCLDVRS